MSNITMTAKQFTDAAAKYGIAVPDSITTALAANPRAQLQELTADAMDATTAIHAALDKGVDPTADSDVQRALAVKAVRSSTGDLDGLYGRRVSAAFRGAWDQIVEAVDAVFTPQAAAYTDAHRVLKGNGLDLQNTEDIRRAGGAALTAWAAALGAQEILEATPRILVAAYLTANPGAYGNMSRSHFTIIPALDSWVRETPSTSDLWAVLDSGATLDLAHTYDEAVERATMVAREQQLANQARREAVRRGSDDQGPATYVGVDGRTRTTDARGMIRSPHNGGAPTHVVNAPDGLVSL